MGVCQAAPSIREVLKTDHGVFDRLAEELDRARLREAHLMRRHICSVLDVLEPALDIHKEIEGTALSAGGKPGTASSDRAVLTAELQRDGIRSLVKDIRIIASDPERYRLEHLASLSFLLSKALREHTAHEQASLWSGMKGLDGSAPAQTVAALRRVEGLLGGI